MEAVLPKSGSDFVYIYCIVNKRMLTHVLFRLPKQKNSENHV